MTGSRWKARCGAWALAGALALAGLAGGGACQREAPAPGEGAGSTPEEAPAPEQPAPPEAPAPEQPAPPEAPAPEQPAAPTAAAPSPAPPEAASPEAPGTAASRPRTPAPPAPDGKAPPAEAPPPGPSGASAPSPEPSGAQALDLDDLERRLRETDAIGVFTKLALKNDIDDLLSAVRAYHRGHDSGRAKLEKLHERFDLLVMKLLSLLQDREPELAGRIASSRQALWQLLADPAQFAKLSS